MEVPPEWIINQHLMLLAIQAINTEGASLRMHAGDRVCMPLDINDNVMHTT